jgi:hypothetical protein
MHATESEFSGFDALPKSKRGTKIIFFAAEVHEMSQKLVTKKFFFIFAPRLDFGYASKPKNSASGAMH